MNTQDLDPDKKSKEGADTSSALPPVSGLNREEIETLWAGSIQKGAEATRTIKVEVKRTEGETTSSVSGRLNLRRQMVAEAGTPIVPPPQYEILKVLGEGGMGVVYEARQTSIDRTIALKMIKPAAAKEKEHRNKFLSEAVATADLDHPNIVPIHDLGSNDEGVLFYAMKQVKGTSWKEAIRTKTLAENLDILMRVADAVAFAHSRGVIHRDLKPENVMLGDFGEVMLMDWGLAASVTDEGKADKLDRETAIGGTPSYMAPEMACGDVGKIGPASDVYLLGAILFEIVTGKRPHTGRDVTDCLVNASRNMIASVEETGELLQIALKAMATEPGDRHENVKAFQGAIREYRTHAESIALVAAAKENLARARQSGNYDDYAQALFGFREALRLWGGNAEAKTGLSGARLTYAERAFENGDFDLATSLLDSNEPIHAELADRVRTAVRERGIRQQRLQFARRMVAGLAASIMVVTTAGFFWIRHEQAKTLEEKERAVKAERAESEERNKALAEKDRAQKAEQVAIAAKEAETAERKKTEEALRQVEYENYVNTIAVADRKIRDGVLSQAKDLLAGVPVRLRNWEWGYLMNLCQREIMTLRPGTDNIRCVAVSPDGSTFLTGSHDTTARLWDAKTGKEIRVFKGHRRDVQSVVFSPDGQRIVTASSDGTVRLWDVGTGKEILTFEGRGTNVVLGVAMAPNGKRVVVWGYHDDTVRLYDVETGKTVSIFSGHPDVLSTAFTPDGGRILTGCDNGLANLLDVTAGKVVRTFKGYCPTLCPSGKEVLILSKDDPTADATILSTATGEKIRSLHRANYSFAAFSPDGIRLITVGLSGMTLRDLQNGDPILTLQNRTHFFESAVFLPDSKYVFSGSADGSATLWDVDAHSSKGIFATDTQGSLFKMLSAGDRMVAVQDDALMCVVCLTSSNNTVIVWDTRQARVLSMLQGQKSRLGRAVFDESGKTLVTGDNDKVVKVWDVESGKEVKRFKVNHWVNKIAVSRDSNLVAATGERTTVWERSTGKLQILERGDRDVMNCIVFSPDNTRLAAGSAGESPTVDVWDLKTGKKHTVLKGHTDIIHTVVFSRDGLELLTGSYDATARLWDVESGTEKKVLRGHSGIVTSVGFSQDGQRLFTVSGVDGTMRVWDIQTAREVVAINCQEDRIGGAGPDSGYIKCEGQRITLSGTGMRFEALDWTKSVEELDREKLARWQKRWEPTGK